MYNEPERETLADPEVTIDNTVKAIMKILAWVKPEIRWRALQRVNLQLKSRR